MSEPESATYKMTTPDDQFEDIKAGRVTMICWVTRRDAGIKPGDNVEFTNNDRSCTFIIEAVAQYDNIQAYFDGEGLIEIASGPEAVESYKQIIQASPPTIMFLQSGSLPPGLKKKSV